MSTKRQIAGEQPENARSRREDRINELARIVVTADEKNTAARTAAGNELATLLLELDPGEHARNVYGAECANVYMEAVAEFMLGFLKKKEKNEEEDPEEEKKTYDPDQPLLPYFYSICRGGWKVDPKSGQQYRSGLMERIWNREYRGIHQRGEERDPDTGRMVTRWVRPVSLDTPQSEGDDDRSLVEFLSGGNDWDPEDAYRWKELGRDVLVPAMVTWLNLQDARGKEVDHLPRMAFTDYMTGIIKGCWGYEVYFERETEIMSAVHRAFLDYFMAQPCKSLRDIHDFALRRFPELKDKLPLDARIYVRFLEDEYHKCVSESTVSRRRKEVREKIKEVVRC